MNGYGTDPVGECELDGFKAGCSAGDSFSFVVIAVTTFQLGFPVSPSAVAPACGAFDVASKDALLLEAAGQNQSFVGQVRTVASEGGAAPARVFLRRLAGGLGQVSREERAFIAFMFAESQINTALRSRVASATRTMLDAVVAMLAKHVHAGELRADADPSAAAHGFFCGFFFFFTQHRHLGTPAWRREASAFAKAWSDLCWRGLASPLVLREHASVSG